MLVVLDILIYYAGYVWGSLVFTIFMNLTRIKKCTGSIYVNGCNKKIYPYNFSDIIKIIAYKQFIVMFYLIFLRKKKMDKVLNIMKFQYIETYKIKYLDLPHDIKIPVRREKSFCCKECWEEHEIIQVAEILTDTGEEYSL